MDLPVELGYGTVNGRFLVAVRDEDDQNLAPDGEPVRGQVVFTASIEYATVPVSSSGPQTIIFDQIVGVFDDQGYLCTPHPESGNPMYRGISLTATDDPDLSVTGWTWKATYQLQSGDRKALKIPDHSFAVPAGAILDLATLVSIPSTPGYGLPQAEAAVLRAEAIAQSIRDDADSGKFNGTAATVEVGTVSSGSAPSVSNSGTEAHAVLNFVLQKGDKGDTGIGVPSDGSPLQVMRMTESGTQTEWVTPSKTMVGLGNVDNTKDLDKPISVATQEALDQKANVVDVSSGLSAKADLRDGIVPIDQLPAQLLVSDANVAGQVNAPQTGAAIDQRINTQVTPVVEQIAADYIASDPAVVDAATAAVDANPKIAELESAKWFRGNYPGGDVFTHSTQGMYWASSGASVPNWPEALSGVGGSIEFTVNSGVKTIVVRSYGARPYTYTTQSNSVLNNTFHPWERVANSSEVTAARWFKGAFTGTNVFTWTEPGLYYVSEAKAGTLTNWPTEMSGVGGFLEVKSDQGRISMEVRGYGLRPYTFRTTTNSVVNNTFHPWERLATKSELDAVAAGIRPIGLNRAVLLDAFTKRRGGRIGVQGKGVVALRFDDPINGLINSGVANALKDLQIPASAVHCSGSFTAPDLIALSDLGSWDHVASWARRQGMEVWHHGGNHQDASGVGALTRETVTSLAALEASLPTLEVNKWAQPGVGGTNYDGYASSNRPELFFDHEAGKLIARGHAVASGYMDGWSRPLDGKPRDGLGHHTVDTPAALTSAYNYVDEAASMGTGLAIMVHPNNLDRAGDYSTSAAFIDFLEYLAQLRDEGKIEVLTLSGLLCADASTSWRAQLIRNAGFTSGLAQYTGATDWAATGGIASTTGTSLLGQIHAVNRHGWVLGGTMQLVAKVKATTGAVVRLHQSSLNDATSWMTEQDITVPASDEWQTVRLNCCVPKNLASSDYVVTRIGRVSGGTLEVDSLEYVPV